MENNTTINLTPEQSEAFVSTLENPPSPNQALQRAAQRYREQLVVKENR